MYTFNWYLAFSSGGYGGGGGSRGSYGGGDGGYNGFGGDGKFLKIGVWCFDFFCLLCWALTI